MARTIKFLAISMLALALLSGCHVSMLKRSVNFENTGTNVDLDSDNKIDAQFLDTHASNHAVDASDSVFPADPDADAFLKWNDTSGALEWDSISGYATLDSPTFTGTPTAPTAAEDTNTTQLATTAFVETATEPAQLLTDIKTVDGSTSGLDSDFLDSLDSTQFLRSDTDDTMDGILTVTGTSQGQIAVERDTSGNYAGFAINDESSNPRWQLFGNNNSDFDLYLRAKDAGDNDTFIVDNDTGVLDFQIAPTYLGSAILYSGATGIDADTLDGHDSTYFSIDGHTHDDHYYTESEIDTLLDAQYIATNITNFDGILSGTNTYVQTALDTIDDHDHAGVYEPVDATILREADVDDTPVNGVTTAPVSSNWAYDHENAADPHTGYMLESNIGTGANNYLQLNGSSQIPAVDGSLITNVDASTLDTLDSTQFLRSDTNDYTTGKLGISISPVLETNNNGIHVDSGANAAAEIHFTDETGRTVNDGVYFKLNNGNFTFTNLDSGFFGFWIGATQSLKVNSDGDVDLNDNALLNIDWANSDDGTGSGLDADTVDGIEGSAFAQTGASTQTFTGQNIFNKLDGYNLLQGAPSAKTATGTFAVTDAEAKIVTVNISSGGTLTLDTAATFDSYFSNLSNDYALEDITIINISTTAADDVTLAGGTGWTMVGNMVIEANDSDRANSSARFRLRKTGTGAWTCYRIS